MPTEREIALEKVKCAYVDIICGVSAIILYLAIILTIFGVPIPNIPSPLAIDSEILASAMPTSGDWIAIILIVTFGAFWGIRLISNAVSTLRLYKEDANPINESTPSPAKV